MELSIKGLSARVCFKKTENEDKGLLVHCRMGFDITRTVSEMPSTHKDEHYTLAEAVSRTMYEGCSKSNASYLTVLAHDIRGRCWWYGSTGWSFPPVFCYILLPCNRWKQRSNLTKWCLTQKVSHWTPPWVKIAHTDIHQHLLNISADKIVDVNSVRQWVATVAVGDLNWCRYLWTWHAGSCSLLSKKHS